MSTYSESDNIYRPDGGEDQPVFQPQPPVQPERPRRKRRAGKIVAVVLVCALAAGAAFGAGYAARDVIRSIRGSETNLYVSSRQPAEVKTVSVDGKTAMSYAELYQANVNSCVSINVSETTNIFNQEATIMASSGSGFIINEDGYVLTNYHVIEGGTEAKVTLYNGETYDAEIIGGDADFDVALLKIDAPDLTPVVIGDSSELRVGDQIAVIGNPLGELTFSMGDGIVSMTDRLINVDGTPFTMIQITAPVNSGNSGGPLFNMYGEVVGIVSAKLSGSSSSSATIEGLGFAIPINDVRTLIEDIMANGYVTNKPYLAVSAGNFSPNMIPGSPVDAGVYLYSVEEGGAADQAGLMAGDIITRLDDTEIGDLDDLTAAKKNYSAGDTAEVEYYRNDQRRTTTLTFDAAPQTDPADQQETQQPTQGYNNPYYTDPWDYFNHFFGTSSAYTGEAA